MNVSFLRFRIEKQDRQSYSGILQWRDNVNLSREMAHETRRGVQSMILFMIYADFQF